MVVPPYITVTLGVPVKTAVLPLLVMVLPLKVYEAPLAPTIAMVAPPVSAASIFSLPDPRKSALDNVRTTSLEAMLSPSEMEALLSLRTPFRLLVTLLRTTSPAKLL